MQNNFFVCRVLRPLIFVTLYFVTSALLPSSGAAAQNTRPGQFATSEAPITFWNRDIAVQRATLRRSHTRGAG